jgi:hypothetical protein
VKPSLPVPEGSTTSAANAQVIELFERLSDEARREHVQALRVKIVTGVMQMEEPSFALSQPLHEVGMDSIMGLEIVAGAKRPWGCGFPRWTWQSVRRSNSSPRPSSGAWPTWQAWRGLNSPRRHILHPNPQHKEGITVHVHHRVSPR